MTLPQLEKQINFVMPIFVIQGVLHLSKITVILRYLQLKRVFWLDENLRTCHLQWELPALIYVVASCTLKPREMYVLVALKTNFP